MPARRPRGRARGSRRASRAALVAVGLLGSALVVLPRVAAAQPSPAAFVQVAWRRVGGTAAPGLPFRYESPWLPRLNELGLRERLDEVVGGRSREFERILRLKDWVAAQFPTTVPDPYPPWDALVVLDWIRGGLTGGFCAQYAQIFLQSLAYLGIPARYVEIGTAENPYGHFLTEVWSSEYDKWVLMDPNYNVHFERDGIPLSALEIHDALLAGAAGTVSPVLGPTREGLPDPYAWPLHMVELFYYLRFDLKADHLTDPATPFDRWNDMVEWQDPRTVPWELSPVPSVFPKERLTRLVTSRADEPYARPAPRGLATVDGTLFFAADDGTRGMELWKADATGAGAVLVKDIRAGGSSDPDWLTGVNGTLFFRASDGATGVELWKSDGTPAGTVLVRDINPGPADSNPAHLLAVGGRLFFTATDGTTGVELWTSDGTAAGTARVADIAPGLAGSVPSGLTSVDGRLYFRACGGPEPTSCRLWTSDGTAAGTMPVAPAVLPPAVSGPSALTRVGDRLFLAACDATRGCELWATDGTEAGTALVKDINPGPADANPANLVAVGGRLFFTATDGTTGVELWTSDGTESGTVMVKDIHPGPFSSLPRSLTVLNDRLFFLGPGSGRATGRPEGRGRWRPRSGCPSGWPPPAAGCSSRRATTRPAASRGPATGRRPGRSGWRTSTPVPAPRSPRARDSGSSRATGRSSSRPATPRRARRSTASSPRVP